MRRELPAQVAPASPYRRGRLFDGRPQVQLALGLDVLLGPVAERHGVLLHAASARRAEAGSPPCGRPAGSPARYSASRPWRRLSRWSASSNSVLSETMRCASRMRIISCTICVCASSSALAARARQQVDQPVLRRASGLAPARLEQDASPPRGRHRTGRGRCASRRRAPAAPEKLASACGGRNAAVARHHPPDAHQPLHDARPCRRGTAGP